MTKSHIYKDQLIEEVVCDHQLSDGLTLCHTCHGNIDERYRRKHED